MKQWIWNWEEPKPEGCVESQESGWDDWCGYSSLQSTMFGKKEWILIIIKKKIKMGKNTNLHLNAFEKWFRGPVTIS